MATAFPRGLRFRDPGPCFCLVFYSSVNIGYAKLSLPIAEPTNTGFTRNKKLYLIDTTKKQQLNQSINKEGGEKYKKIETVLLPKSWYQNFGTK